MTGQDPKFECDALPPAREALTPRAARALLRIVRDAVDRQPEKREAA